MSEEIRKLQQQLQRVEGDLKETRAHMERDVNHVLGALASQREAVTQALGQVQVAMLEQEMQLRSFLQATQANMGRLQDGLSQSHSTLEGVFRLLEDHEARLRELEKRPPAA